MKIINHEDKIEFVPENDYERQSLERIATGQSKISWTKAWDAHDKTGNMAIHIAKSWD